MLTPNFSIDRERPLALTNANAKADDRSNDPFVKPAPPLRREANSFSELQDVVEEEKQTEKSPPASPNKRWSPSKSSWLENAINKSDSQKLKAAPPLQPSWMSDLNKAKQQRGSVDLGKPKDFREVTTGGFMRSPPMGGLTKPPFLGGLHSGFSAGVASKPKVNSPGASSQTQASADTPKASEELKPVVSSESPTKGVASLDEKPDQRKPATEKDAPVARSPSPKTPAERPVGRSSPLVNAKPETPPKKDFTSNLRPRKAPGAKETKEEPEFKNVFGKLKRTQTQNYKAPDELKDNLMRGKAGLNVTGGPKQTVRKDEFKESIVKKKEGMKAGLPSASTTIRSASRLLKEQDAPIPEALAKRRGLARSGSTLSNTTNGDNHTEPTEPLTTSGTKKPEAESEPIPAQKAPSAPARMRKEPAVNGKLGGNFNAALAGIISRGPSPMASSNGIGPTRAPGEDAHDHLSPTGDNHIDLDGGRQLSHLTKGRARGPKRRLPTGQSSASTMSSDTPQPEKARAPSPVQALDISTKARDKEPTLKASEVRPLANISHNNRKVSQPSSPRKSSTSISLPDNAKQQFPKPVTKEIESAKTSPQVKQKPTITTEITEPRKPSSPTAQPVPIRSLKSPDLQKPSQARSILPTRQPESGSASDDVPKNSVKGAAAIWQQSPSTQYNSVRSPIKLPTRKDEEAAHEQAGLRTATAKVSIGLGIETANNKPQALSSFTSNLPASPAASPRSPKSPPLPAKKSASIASRVPSTNLASQPPPWKSATSLSPNSEASRVLTDFFRDSPVCNTKFNIDTQSIISARSSHDGSDKIKTLRKQISEVAGDGKLLPVPSHQEHILFEENLYLCTHVFGSVTGTRTTEVYLWCGDAVPTSAVEDAQLFCRKVARDNNSKLIILKQGKETANFFQALGGIVITRRGSNAQAGSPSSSAATYMLCGRRHVGQIAFDEVDLTPSRLCKGFPYIISARFGKLYLWKGSGSGADELGCARLIGMDIGLTGEIDEVDDGREPASFWEAFPDGKQCAQDGDAARHWHLKASCEKYATRLFSVEVEASRPKSSSSFLWGRRGSAPTNDDDGTMTAVVNEIVSFAQSDLDSEGIYVLDAFFEIYV